MGEASQKLTWPNWGTRLAEAAGCLTVRPPLFSRPDMMTGKILRGHVYTAVIILFSLTACASIVRLNGAGPFGPGLNSCWRAMVAQESIINATKVHSRSAMASNSSVSETSLTYILNKASMANKTVIIAPLNEAWAANGSVLGLFFESFRIGIGTKRLLKHLVIVAVDPKAYAHCKTVHKHCYFLETPGVDFSQEQRYMTPDYLKLVWRKIDFLGSVLELGYSFVFTDVDIMWLRDPFPGLRHGRQKDIDADFVISCDFYNGNSSDMWNRANSGFQYVKANYRSTAFYRHWYRSREKHPGQKTQDVFDVIKTDQFTEELGIKFRFLDTAYFGSFCDIKDKDPGRLKTMHTTCCVGIQNKAQLLRIILDDWANYSTINGLRSKAKNRIANTTNYPWSFPSSNVCETEVQ